MRRRRQQEAVAHAQDALGRHIASARATSQAATEAVSHSKLLVTDGLELLVVVEDGAVVHAEPR